MSPETALAFEHLAQITARIQAAKTEDAIAQALESLDGPSAGTRPAAHAIRAQAAAVAEMARDRLRATALLKQSHRHLELLMAGVSHDLRNPLNTFAMSAGILRDDLDRGEVDIKRELGLVARMERGIDRMRRMIDDLLDASHLTAGSLALERQKVRLAAALTSLAQGPLGALVAERSGNVTLEAIDPAIELLVDARRFDQMLLRAATYLFRLSGDGATLRLRAERTAGELMLVVTAAGPNAPPSSQPADEGRAGLSLLLVRGIATLHGGRVDVKPGESPELTITLPAAT